MLVCWLAPEHTKYVGHFCVLVVYVTPIRAPLYPRNRPPLSVRLSVRQLSRLCAPCARLCASLSSHFDDSATQRLASTCSGSNWAMVRTIDKLRLNTTDTQQRESMRRRAALTCCAATCERGSPTGHFHLFTWYLVLCTLYFVFCTLYASVCLSSADAPRVVRRE